MGDQSGVHNQTGQCVPLQTPVVGTLKLVSGNGTSVGTVMSLQCPSRHRVVSGSQMSCVWSSNKTHWSGGTPECKPLSRFDDAGFRLALLMSFISSAIILVMSIIFITSCLVRHVKREERRKMERARKTGASEFWQQIDVEGVEMQREGLHSQKSTNSNKNNNNNNNNSSGERRQHTDKHIYSYADLHTPCRCLQQGKPCPQSIHPSQFSLILAPPTDYLINTHMGPVDTRHAFPLPCDSAGDRHFCRTLQDPLWNAQHLFSPHRPPLQMMSI
ncbi:Sushi domain-containing protein 3 [Labeo rohita]|uniref:Sushi domain-containing protein 3 n=1 Tax=Labeo rohita TaxID=84645 RepID=A0ABQ8MH68_LABRO|nr:sushi domain-containing protein 3 [Labeo rohita]KAI2661213.1 Sushi domain-containing protein 3 [Labeo rohita]